MNSKFLTYQQSLALVELGFKEKCLAEINNYEAIHIKGTRRLPSAAVMTYEIPCPLKQEAFDWFRIQHGLDSYRKQMTLEGSSYWKITKFYTDDTKHLGYSKFEPSYLEAESTCLDKLIDIVKKKLDE